jgi:hypothetical protein
MQPLKTDPVRDTVGSEEVLGFRRGIDVFRRGIDVFLGVFEGVDRGNPATVIF